MAYALGAVKPFVADVANQVGPMFGVTNIGGWRATATDMSGHPAGLALDFQVGDDSAKGGRVASYFTSNASRLRVKYVIWQQRIWWPGKNWQPMEYRSGDAPGYDPNHKRHVHVSFLEGAASSGGAGVVPDSKGGDDDGGFDITNPLGITNPLDGAAKLFEADTWKRVGLVVGGAVAMLVGVAILVTSSKEVSGAAVAAIPHPAAKAAGAVLATTGD